MEDNIKKLRERLELKKKQLLEETKVVEVTEPAYPVEIKEGLLTHTCYDVYQDPTKKSRHFLIVKINYNPETGTAEVEEIRPFEDKTAGLSMVSDKDNRQYLFNKCKGKN